ncbi:hypothetical protein Cni_G04123 [Canna indica]|uniref:Uncharacterized protein n=1 Tax=Canna indica TaxID=4628 RepID=A0AAQ3JT20_9LILI|nr:hypothetical protein Cni_G04123 [Canna indica]
MLSSVRSRGGSAAEIVKERRLGPNAFSPVAWKLRFLGNGIRAGNLGALERLEREARETAKHWERVVVVEVDAITVSKKRTTLQYEAAAVSQ